MSTLHSPSATNACTLNGNTSKELVLTIAKDKSKMQRYHKQKKVRANDNNAE